MRKWWTAVLTPVLALAFFIAGSPAANAFGSEVLGCAVNSGAWTANTCSGDSYAAATINYSPQNLSGTYSKRWTVTGPDGTPVTANCSSTVTANCIDSGCTLSSTSCVIKVPARPYRDAPWTASLRLTQSGLTRTIQAQAWVYPIEICLKCQ
jgi:hypothetical protein